MRHNLDAHFARPYAEGDRLALGYEGVIDVPDTDPDEKTLAAIFAMHNADNRPDGGSAPSLSVGDVIELPGFAYSVGMVGFINVVIGPRDRLSEHWQNCR